MLTAADVEAWCRLEGVPSALAAARDAIDARLRDRGLRRTASEVTAESLLRGAAASARLEGSPTALEALRAGTGDATAMAAARLNADLLSLVPIVRRSPLQAFARLHSLAAAGQVDDELLGRPSTDPGLASLRALSTVLSTPTRAAAIAVAGVAHAEVATAEPFASANGLVARALERLALVALGVDPASVIVVEEGHLVLGSDYRTGLAAYAEGDARGVRTWLLHVAAAVTRGVEASPLGAADSR